MHRCLGDFPENFRRHFRRQVFDSHLGDLTSHRCGLAWGGLGGGFGDPTQNIGYFFRWKIFGGGLRDGACNLRCGLRVCLHRCLGDFSESFRRHFRRQVFDSHLGNLASHRCGLAWCGLGGGFGDPTQNLCCFFRWKIFGGSLRDRACNLRCGLRGCLHRCLGDFSESFRRHFRRQVFDSHLGDLPSHRCSLAWCGLGGGFGDPTQNIGCFFRWKIFGGGLRDGTCNLRCGLRVCLNGRFDNLRGGIGSVCRVGFCRLLHGSAGNGRSQFRILGHEGFDCLRNLLRTLHGCVPKSFLSLRGKLGAFQF